jgi:hypothetical protein
VYLESWQAARKRAPIVAMGVADFGEVQKQNLPK